MFNVETGSAFLFLSILTDHDPVWSNVENDWSFTAFEVIFLTLIYVVLKALDQMSSSVEIRGSITRSRLKPSFRQSMDQSCFILQFFLFIFWLLHFQTFTEFETGSLGIFWSFPCQLAVESEVQKPWFLSKCTGCPRPLSSLMAVVKFRVFHKAIDRETPLTDFSTITCGVFGNFHSTFSSVFG